MKTERFELKISKADKAALKKAAAAAGMSMGSYLVWSLWNGTLSVQPKAKRGQ